MMAVNRMHVQWMQMWMSVVVIQVRVEVRVMVPTLVFHFDAYIRDFHADISEAWRCWAMMDANEFLDT